MSFGFAFSSMLSNSTNWDRLARFSNHKPHTPLKSDTGVQETFSIPFCWEWGGLGAGSELQEGGGLAGQ